MLQSRAKPSFFLPNHPKKARAPSVSFWETLPEPRLHTPAQSMVACPALKQNKTKRWTPRPRTSGETAVLSSSCLLSGHSRQAAPPSAGSVGGAWTPARGASDRASPAPPKSVCTCRAATPPAHGHPKPRAACCQETPAGTWVAPQPPVHRASRGHGPCRLPGRRARPALPQAPSDTCH